MTANDPAFALQNHVVLLPWGPGHANDNDGVRCDIERLQGTVSYALPPQRPHGAYGAPAASATHEYVPDGALPTTGLPALPEATLKAWRATAEQQALAWIAPLRRLAYVPVLGPATGQGTESRYFGGPWLPEGTDWPTLHGDRMAFVMQLNTATLPMDHPAWSGTHGVLLVFHSEHFEDGPAMSHVMLVDPTLPGRVHQVPGLTDVNPALVITGWREVVDVPDGETLDGLDGFTEAIGDVLMGVASDTVDMVRMTDGTQVPERQAIEQGLTGACHNHGCDKLGGWPSWAQGDETPMDGNGDAMDYVLQIGYEGLLLVDDAIDLEAIEWPTWGRGQVFASLATGEWAYVWACD